MKCISNKNVYLTQEIAEDVLIEARIKFDYAANDGPIGVYRCEDCGYYHLTSKGQMNAKLANYLATGKVKMHKEAAHWLGKMKKK